ncbi:hypothetical protein PsYK624_104800 [Phanerochaete sordida]|uniref:Uncharacterized protein n=1 Tax=Phanerochaete sordida TaxID=48140 RepID=A0A9P3GG42_9APHY|nr:hypothetical protein PsYK624_104800 [Phanerochaete sordida]
MESSRTQLTLPKIRDIFPEIFPDPAHQDGAFAGPSTETPDTQASTQCSPQSTWSSSLLSLRRQPRAMGLNVTVSASTLAESVMLAFNVPVVFAYTNASTRGRSHSSAHILGAGSDTRPIPT